VDSEEARSAREPTAFEMQEQLLRVLAIGLYRSANRVSDTDDAGRRHAAVERDLLVHPRAPGSWALPRADRDAAPLLRLDVAPRLAQLPAMASGVLDEARPLPVLPRVRLLKHLGSGVAGAREGSVDVGHPDLDEVRDDSLARRDLSVAHVGDDHGT